jgi:hypothetical protein
MTVINYNEVPTYKIKQLIDLAGFNVVTTERGVHLYDKSYPNMDYADLSFRNLKEAVKTIDPYLQRIKFKIIL